MEVLHVTVAFVFGVTFSLAQTVDRLRAFEVLRHRQQYGTRMLHKTGQDRTTVGRARSFGCEEVARACLLVPAASCVYRTGEDRTGQDSMGEDRRGQDRTGQDRTGQDRTGQDRRG